MRALGQRFESSTSRWPWPRKAAQRCSRRWRWRPCSPIPAWAQARFAVLQTVSLLAEFYPPLNAYVSAGARTPLRIAADALPAFLFDTLPVVRLLGIRALLPKALERLLRPRLSLQIKGQAQRWRRLPQRRRRFRFRLAGRGRRRAAVARRIRGAGARGHRRDPFQGRLCLSRCRPRSSACAPIARPPALSSSELLRAALAGEYGGAAIGLDEAAQRLLQQLREAGEVALPTAVQATLRPYQQRGYAWLYRNAPLGFGSVIADDMGLGKTLQVIATLQKLTRRRRARQAKALVIVPTSLLTNWQKEIARFAPALSVAVFHGSTARAGDRAGATAPGRVAHHLWHRPQRKRRRSSRCPGRYWWSTRRRTSRTRRPPRPGR
jgi:hypothetical protein